MIYKVYMLMSILLSGGALANNDQDNKPLEPLPTRWKASHIKEPIFEGDVHVIEAGKSQAKTIILVHGLGYNGLRDWLEIIKELESDYHIVALDLPGFGESDDTSIQLAPQRYAELLKWLIPKYTQKQVVMVGHSMGAAISLRFTAEYPDMVEKLVMVDTAGILHRSVFVRHLTQMPDRYEWLAKYQQRFHFIDSTVNKFNRFVNRISSSVLGRLDRLPDPTLILLNNKFAQKYVYKDRPTLNAAIGLINEDFSEAIAKLEVPTHIIWGEHDRVAPLRTGHLLSHHLKKAQLHVIEGAGHVPMKDDKEVFMQKLHFSLTSKPSKYQTKDKHDGSQLTDLRCDNQNDVSYRGHYRNVYIKDCKYVRLTQLFAHNLVVENSEVTMEDINILSDAVAVDISRSFITMTNATLAGDTALKINNSTLDMAGTRLVSEVNGIEVVADSLIYVSVSQYDQDNNIQFLHGMSQGNVFDLR